MFATLLFQGESYDIGSIMGWIKTTMVSFGVFGLFQTGLAIVIIIGMVSLVLRLVSGSRG